MTISMTWISSFYPERLLRILSAQLIRDGKSVPAERTMADVLQIRRPQVTLHSLRVFSMIYLATPYTKYEKGLQQAAEDACFLAGRLFRNGVKIYSPIAHGHMIAKYGDLNPLDVSIWTPHNQTMAKMCQALLVGELDGWGASDGVLEEVELFKKDGKPAYGINPNSLSVRSL